LARKHAPSAVKTPVGSEIIAAPKNLQMHRRTRADRAGP
jgi:hypothetical protein